MHRILRHSLLATLAGLTLSGCLGLNKPPPPFLIRLSPEVTASAGESRHAAAASALLIKTPAMPSELRANRILVARQDNNLAYLTGAKLADFPSRLFHRLLVEVVTAHSSGLVLGEGRYTPISADQLAGQLVDFNVDAESESVLVTYDAMLITERGAHVHVQRFSAREPLASMRSPAVAAALNAAANRVASEVALWVDSARQAAAQDAQDTQGTQGAQGAQESTQSAQDTQEQDTQ